MDWLQSILPERYRKTINTMESVPDEIRMTVGQPLLIRWADREQWVEPHFDALSLESVLTAACRQSVYAHNETLCQGFLSVDGGHRIGICGTGVIREGTVSSLKGPTSMLVRIAKDIHGCADGLIGRVPSSCLIAGPPGSGKTTMLRDLIRQLSDQKLQRISLVDERGEVAAVQNGTPRFYVGKRTDILSLIPKRIGIDMVLRTMNPQWIAVDEITSAEDAALMERGSYCGVRFLATAHAECYEDLFQRPVYRTMMEMKLFRTLVFLHPDRTYEVREVNN